MVTSSHYTVPHLGAVHAQRATHLRSPTPTTLSLRYFFLALARDGTPRSFGHKAAAFVSCAPQTLQRV